MNSSGSGEKASGVSNISAGNQSLNFNSPAVQRSGSGLSKPKMVKVRRRINSQDSRSASIPTSCFNHFPPATEVSVPASSVFQKGSIPSEFPPARSGDEVFVFGASRRDSSMDCGKLESGETLGRDVVDEMRNLRIGGEKGFVNTEIGAGIINASSEPSLHETEDSRKGSSAFGTGRSASAVDENTRQKPMESVGTENTETSWNSEGFGEVNYSIFGSCASDRRTKLGVDDLTTSSVNPVDSELPNELKKLNIKDTWRQDCGSTKFNTVDGTQFEFDSRVGGNSVSGSSENILPEKMKNLDIGDYTTSESVKNKEANIKTGGKEFGFSNEPDSVGKPFVEFSTTNQANLVYGLKQKMEFSAKKGSVRDSRGKKKGGKFKQPTAARRQLGQGFVSKESSFQGSQETSECYSPMDISPYREEIRENSVASYGSLNLDSSLANAESESVVPSDEIDEDLVVATEHLKISEDNAGGKETEEKDEEGSENQLNISEGTEGPLEESISGAETESFKSATEELDFNSDATATSAEAEISPSAKFERNESDSVMHSDFSLSSDDITRSDFIFSALSAAQCQLSSSKRQHRKKSSVKVGHDTFTSAPNSTKVPYASSSVQFVSLSASSSPPTPEWTWKGDQSNAKHKHGDDSRFDKGKEINEESVSTKKKQEPVSANQKLDPVFMNKKQEPASVNKKQGLVSNSSASAAAQEACEKWRLRGNQAYANGDLSKAEDYYTQGVNCVSKDETSRSCLRALMLCYSNRAATRMALGRIRDAISDCRMAVAIDPSFPKVQLRAANCYLALGEVEEALPYLKKCLSSGSEVCVDRKIAVEASDCLENAQKISRCVSQSAELLQQGTSADLQSALGLISEALTAGPYSEKLLEMKVEALYRLRRYEEVIEVCKQTLGSAEKNSPAINNVDQVKDLDIAEVSKKLYFRIWRCQFILKSYFHRGKLEEGIAFLDQQEERVSLVARNGRKILDSSIPLAVPVRELLRLKAAGNEAFQAGRHSEAVEHYTAALSCNVESHTFTAVCFCNRAAAYKALGQVTDAIADCSMAIALDGKYLKAISRRATLYEMIRDHDNAVSDLQRLVDLLTKQLEEKTNQSGMYDRSLSGTNDLKQAHLRLSEIEEEARREIPLDFYLILGVDPSVSAAEIRKAYRKAALRHHPDKACQFLARTENGDDGLWREIASEVHKDADKIFKMIGEAYAVLSDPTKRSRYDAEEEMRNAQKKRGGSGVPRTHPDVQNYQYDMSARRQWRDVWRSYGDSVSKGPEATRTSRYS